MDVLFRVNNELFGILHLNERDPQAHDVETHRIPSPMMIPRVLPLAFLQSHGFNKGDVIILSLDESMRHVIALKRESGEVLWSA